VRISFARDNERDLRLEPAIGPSKNVGSRGYKSGEKIGLDGVQDHVWGEIWANNMHLEQEGSTTI